MSSMFYLLGGRRRSRKGDKLPERSGPSSKYYGVCLVKRSSPKDLNDGLWRAGLNSLALTPRPRHKPEIPLEPYIDMAAVDEAPRRPERPHERLESRVVQYEERQFIFAALERH